MKRRFQFLAAALTALALGTSACDKKEEKKDDKADAKKDEKKDEKKGDDKKE